MLLCYYVIYDICINLQNLIVDLEIEGNMSSLMEDQVYNIFLETVHGFCRYCFRLIARKNFFSKFLFVHLFFYNLCGLRKNLFNSRTHPFLGGAPTSICHFFHLSVCHTPYLRNCTSSGHNF